MSIPHPNEQEKTYEFRGKTFSCQPSIIQVLNIALATNGVNDRYIEVKKNAS
jgi:hypothetical protein